MCINDVIILGVKNNERKKKEECMVGQLIMSYLIHLINRTWTKNSAIVRHPTAIKIVVLSTVDLLLHLWIDIAILIESPLSTIATVLSSNHYIEVEL